MEASTAGAPAVADPAAQTPAQPEAPAQGQPQAPQPGQVPQQAVQPATAFPPQPQGDVQTQLQQMEARNAELQAQLQQAQGGQEPAPTDLLSALQPEPGGDDLGFTPEQLAAIQAGQDPNQMDQGQQDAQLKELDDYMNQRIQEALEPLQQERAVEQVQAFGKEHPDIMQPEILKEVEASMENAIGRYGDGARYDTALLNLAYTAAKAKLADAGAVPAEQAAQNGASVETQAGQTQQGEPSVEESYVQSLTGAASGGDQFT